MFLTYKGWQYDIDVDDNHDLVLIYRQGEVEFRHHYPVGSVQVWKTVEWGKVIEKAIDLLATIEGEYWFINWGGGTDGVVEPATPIKKDGRIHPINGRAYDLYETRDEVVEAAKEKAEMAFPGEWELDSETGYPQGVEAPEDLKNIIKFKGPKPGNKLILRISKHIIYKGE